MLMNKKPTVKQQRKIDRRARKFRRWNRVYHYNRSATYYLMFVLGFVAVGITLPLWIPFIIMHCLSDSKKNRYAFCAYELTENNGVKFKQYF